MMQEFFAEGGASGPSWLIAMPLVFIILLAWSMVWKGVALWRAGQKGHLGWFIALFIINTVGILEIVYLLTAGKKEVKPEMKPNV